MSRRPAYHAGSTTRQIRNRVDGPGKQRWWGFAREDSDPAPSPDQVDRVDRVDRVLVVLTILAVVSRFVWVLWVHPPRDHVFSDMAHYVHRARMVALGDVGAGDRAMAWQAWGTHALLAIPMILLGPTGASALELAGLMWAGFSAATVVLGYRLAVRVLPGGHDRHDGHARQAGLHWPATAVGVMLLLWFPLVSHTGFFVSETPYACVLVALTHAIVVLIQDGEGAGRAGVFAALAFALRPQVAVFLALLGLAWLADRYRHRHRQPSWSAKVDLRALAWFAVPLAVVLAISLVRVRVYTGEWGGVAENGTMNLTAGRCHNIVTRAFDDQAALDSAQATGAPQATRRVSLPGFRALDRAGPDHPLALRPALGGESIDFVGYIGDRAVHRQLRARCYAATGIAGQLRYSVTNLALSWVVARPWPESSDHTAPELLPIAIRGRDLAAWLAPWALLGLGLALWRWRPLRRRSRIGSGLDSEVELGRQAGLGICALQLASLLITAALFFGTPRLRTPYDPYALILAFALALELGRWVADRRRTPGPR